MAFQEKASSEPQEEHAGENVEVERPQETLAPAGAGANVIPAPPPKTNDVDSNSEESKTGLDLKSREVATESQSDAQVETPARDDDSEAEGANAAACVAVEEKVGYAHQESPQSADADAAEAVVEHKAPDVARHKETDARHTSAHENDEVRRYHVVNLRVNFIVTNCIASVSCFYILLLCNRLYSLVWKLKIARL